MPIIEIHAHRIKLPFVLFRNAINKQNAVQRNIGIMTSPTVMSGPPYLHFPNYAPINGMLLRQLLLHLHAPKAEFVRV